MLTQKSEGHADKKIVAKNTLRDKYLSYKDFNVDVFPDISDEVIENMVSLVYLKLNQLSYTFLTPLLENKKIQKKVVHTLLYIHQAPFRTGIFPTYQYLEAKNTEDIN
jgi:hypothetical protein